MNRLIIIGNGFDLAHGRKTSYYDFILNHLQNCFETAYKEGSFEDEIFTIINQERNVVHASPKTFTDLKTFRNFQVDIRDKYLYAKDVTIDPQYKLYIKFPFIKELIDEACEFNWVDIERRFYAGLVKSLKITDTSQEVANRKRIQFVKELNMQLDYLKNNLIVYLNSLPPVDRMEDYNTIIKLITDSTRIDNTLILDFNYTNTSDIYGCGIT